MASTRKPASKKVNRPEEPVTVKKKHKKKKKRGFPVFYTIYWTLVILALIAIAIGLRYVWNLCEDYESAQPKYVAQEYQDMFTSRNVTELINLSGAEAEVMEYEDQADYAAYILSLLEDKEITCNPSYSADDDIKIYTAKADGKRFGEFRLVKSGKQSEYGQDLWVFDALELDVPAQSTNYTVKCFSNYDVYVNGEKLSTDYITQEGIEPFAEKIELPKSVYKPSFNVYTFPIHFADPEITVIAQADGSEGVLIPDEGSETGYHMDYTYSDKAKASLNDRVIAAAKAYCTFISEDGSRYNAMKYILSGSNMEKKLDAYDNQWFTPHNKYYFSGETTYNYMVLSDTCVCCNVQMLFTITSSAGNKQNYPVTYRFYLGYSSAKGEWMIFDYESIEFDYDLYYATIGKTQD